MSNTTLTQAQSKLLDYLEANPEATIPEIMANFGYSSRNSVHVQVRKLVEAGILERPVIERTGWTINRK